MQFVCDPGELYGLKMTESTIYEGDVAQILRTFPDSFFQCCVTSPPY